MGPTASIAPIGTAHGCELIAHEMFITGTTMATAAEYADLIYKVTFLQYLIFTLKTAIRPDCKYTLTIFNPLI